MSKGAHRPSDGRYAGRDSGHPTGSGTGREAGTESETGDPRLVELIGTLRMLDIRLTADGDSLHYDAPPHVMTDDLLARLREHKTGLLRWLTGGSGQRPVERSGPATFAQRRMYHQQKASTRPAAFNVAQRIPVEGPLNPEVLGRALTALCRRQDALRSRLVEYGTNLVQEVTPSAPIPVPLVDLRDLPERDRKVALSEHALAAASRPFDLEEAPLLRTILMRTGGEEWTLILVVHHIVIDGWGLAVLLSELAALYKAARLSPERGLPDDADAGLAPLTTAYTDVGRWERERLSGAHLQRLRAFWRDWLADAPLDLALPYDRPRPEQLSGRGGTVEVPVPADLTARIEAMAKEHGTTMFVVLLSALGVLLGRLSGQPEVVVACNMANRRQREHEALVGFFGNNVAVRIRVGEAQRFADLIDSTGQAFFAGVDHQGYPIGMLVHDLAPRLADQKIHFPKAIVVMQNQFEPVLNLPGMTAKVHDIAVDGSKYDLTVALACTTDHIMGLFEYSTDVFDTSTIERWGAAYVDLLSQAVDEPSRSPQAFRIPSETAHGRRRA